jgi:hypothetical protein
MGTSEHEQGLVRLAKVLVGLTGYSGGCISIVVRVNRYKNKIKIWRVLLTLLLSWIKHHINHIFDVLEALVFKVENDISNELFLCPDEKNSILHNFSGDLELFEILDSRTTESLATFFRALSFLLLLSTTSEDLFAMVCPLWIQENALDILNFNLFARIVFVIPFKLGHCGSLVNLGE